MNASPTIDTFLWRIQSAIRDYLYTDEYFRQFPILTQNMKDVASDVEEAEQGVLQGPSGKHGLSILIRACGGGGSIPDAPGSYHMNARAIFVIAEVPVQNLDTANGGTGQPGLTVAEVLVAMMKRYDSLEEGCHTNFREPENAIGDTTYIEDTGLVAHVVTMLMHGGNNDLTEVVATPVIVQVSDGIVTISSATVGATIYYTVDGTRPTGPPIQNGTLYTGGSLVIGEGTVIKARAYFPGMRASLIATETGAGGLVLTADGVTGLSPDDSVAISP